jgi:hypothetical protein
MAHDECPMAISLKEGRDVRGAEIVVERPDGQRVFVLPYPTILRDDSGRIIGAVNMLVDISERAAAERRRRLLINELNHRVKNTLASVQSIAIRRFVRGGTAGVQMVRGEIDGPVPSARRADEGNWESVGLKEIVSRCGTKPGPRERSFSDGQKYVDGRRSRCPFRWYCMNSARMPRSTARCATKREGSVFYGTWGANWRDLSLP